jgi:anti-sigma regulatory factor (Ser/Thr protein kinase)
MRAQRVYPNDAKFVAQARRFVSESVGRVPRTFLFDLQLMTSELVNNAIVHAASECTVAVETRDGLIIVAVTDGGEGEPVVRPPRTLSLSGRGLMIISALARDWGVERDPARPGKTVWFSVERPPMPDPEPVTAEVVETEPVEVGEPVTAEATVIGPAIASADGGLAVAVRHRIRRSPAARTPNGSRATTHPRSRPRRACD